MVKAICPVLAAALLLSACAATPSHQMNFYPGGEPALKGVVANQARLIVSISRAASMGTQGVTGLTFDSADLTLTNGSGLLSTPATATADLTGNLTQTVVFSALRPGGGYALDLVLKNGGTRVGGSHASSITLAAGTSTTVGIVIGKDNQITIATSEAKNTAGSAGAWVIAKGDKVVLNTGFASAETNAVKMCVYLDAVLYGTRSKIAEKTSGFNQFEWATGTATNTATESYNPASLMVTSGGTVTFELLNSSDKIIGRTSLENVTIEGGANIDLNLL